jgi:hypothetical protein
MDTVGRLLLGAISGPTSTFLGFSVPAQRANFPFHETKDPWPHGERT